MPDIIYVNERDEEIGHGTIRNAVKNGIIKRVSQVFLFNAAGEVLIQKRGMNTIAFAGRWNASAAGHVDAGETYLEAMLREMEEEIGVSSISLQDAGNIYMEEREGDELRKSFCTVYAGRYDGPVSIDGVEAVEVRWVTPGELARWLAERPDDFTPSFIQGYRLLEQKGERG